MKFFVPETPDPTQAERAYESIRRFNTEQTGARLNARRIYSIQGIHNGQEFSATVGQPFGRLAEPVFAILLDTRRNVYLVCTSTRGVIRGEPYLRGNNEIRHIEDFE